MTKGDYYTKKIFTRILEEGTLDKYPRPKYSDGTSAHTLSVNHGFLHHFLIVIPPPVFLSQGISMAEGERG